jgi:hypothetical protein
MQTQTGGQYPGAPSWTIYLDGSTYYGKNQYGTNSYTGSTADTVTQSIVTALGSNGGSITYGSGTFNFATSVTVTSYITIQGQGYSTILKPTTATTIFTITAPQTRISIKNLQIMDSDSHTTTQPAIYLDNTNDAISLCDFENIQTYYYASAIATSQTTTSDLAHGIISCTFKTIYANEYTYQGFIFRRVFDSKFFDIFTRAHSATAQYGFRFEYAIDSGSSITGLTTLGYSGINYDGITINGVSNIYCYGLIADSFKEGYTFQQRCDWIVINGLEARSCTDHGIYLNSTSGRVTVNGANFISEGVYGVRNFGNGGFISINGATVYGNGVGNYALLGGDSFVNGFNETNGAVKNWPCLINSGVTSITNFGDVIHGLDGVPTSVSGQTNLIDIQAQAYSWNGTTISFALWNTTSNNYYSGTANVMWIATKNPTS